MLRSTFFSIISVFALTVGCNAQASRGGFENIPVDKVVELDKEAEIVIIDVRTPGEVKNGYLIGTDHFFDISNGSFQNEILALDKEKTYVMVCQSGARSSRAANFMIQNGFKHVINMSGGMGSVRNASFVVRP
jgi:rhodanese-related sulfurtransferase